MPALLEKQFNEKKINLFLMLARNKCLFINLKYRLKTLLFIHNRTIYYKQ
jgi:hypothetical protein